MTSISSYTHYAHTSFHGLPEEDELINSAPTPPAIPNNPGVESSSAEKAAVANYIDSVHAYLDNAGHTNYSAQLTGIKFYISNITWVSEQNLYYLIGITQLIIATAQSPSALATQAAKDALAGYAGQVELYLAQLNTAGTITPYSYNLLKQDVEAQKNLINHQDQTANSAQYNIFNHIFTQDSNPPAASADEKTAQTIYTEAQTKTSAYVKFLTGLNSSFNGASASIASDKSAATTWLGKVSSSTNPQAATSALNDAQAKLTQADHVHTQWAGSVATVSAAISAANSTLASILSDIASIHAHPDDHTANTPLISDMQTKTAQIPTNFPQNQPGFQGAIRLLEQLISDAETEIISVRQKYFPNNQPPAIPPGMMYLDVAYLKPNGSAISIDKMDAYLRDLKAAGCDTVILNFVMLSDLDKLESRTAVYEPWASSWNDGTVKTFASRAELQDMKIWLSIGGASIPFDAGTQKGGYDLNEDPTVFAQGLAKFIQEGAGFKIAGIDFDLESSCLKTDSTPHYPTPEQWQTLVKALRSNLSASGQKLSFTTLANPDQFAQFAYHDPSNHPFFSMFDEFNPETYDGGDQPQGHYYLNSRYFTQWTQAKPPTPPANYMVPKPVDGVYKHMHVGFFDTPLVNKGRAGASYIPYIEGATQFPTPVDGGAAIPDDTAINATTPGQAAAQRYIAESLQNGALEFGAVYFWPDEATAYPPANGLPGTDFEKDFFQEYMRWNWLHNIGGLDNRNTSWNTFTNWLPWTWRQPAA